MEAFHSFTDPKPYQPDFYESQCGDELRPQLSLSRDGHTFVFKLDGPENTYELLRTYTQDGDEVADDIFNQLHPYAEKVVQQRLHEISQKIGEYFA